MTVFEALLLCHIVQRLMREIRVVIVDPFTEGDLEVEWSIPLVRPYGVLFDCTHDLLGVGIALGIRPGQNKPERIEEKQKNGLI